MSDIELSEKQIDEIATKAAQKALRLVYEEVGRSVLKKLFWIVGAVTLALFVWLNKGHLPAELP